MFFEKTNNYNPATLDIRYADIPKISNKYHEKIIHIT